MPLTLSGNSGRPAQNLAVAVESVNEIDFALPATPKTVLATRSRWRSVVIKTVLNSANGDSGVVVVKVAEVVVPVPDDDSAQLERRATV